MFFPADSTPAWKEFSLSGTIRNLFNQVVQAIRMGKDRIANLFECLSKFEAYFSPTKICYLFLVWVEGSIWPW